MTTHGVLRREWTRFRRPGRLIAMAAAFLAVVAVGLLSAFGNHQSCSGYCPAEPVGPDGSVVNDESSFLHRDLGVDGSITVRLTSMTGTITYPPPDHDEIVPGLVPWAKVGIMIKDGVAQGSSYAALMLTGGHGVRMQHDYRHDVAGRGGRVSPESPRWLRLTRSGDVVSGYESADGEQWAKVGTARLTGLPETVQVGLFAASPGDLTLRPVALGGAVEEVRFTQAVGVFDHVDLEGAPAAQGWSEVRVGDAPLTDWEKYHQPPGAVVTDGTITVTGAGDIGPAGVEDGGSSVKDTLDGLPLALLVVLVTAARFGSSGRRRDPVQDVVARDMLAARALVVAVATFVTGLLALCVVVPLGTAIMQGNGITVVGASALTEARVVVGTAAALALSAVVALALGALFRRTWLAIFVAVVAIAVPYVVTSFPLLDDGLSQWLLRVTPAAGFAAQQTLVEYRQVVAHYAPSVGYFPLSWWAGLAVLSAYAAALLGLALRRRGPAGAPQERCAVPAGWTA